MLIILMILNFLRFLHCGKHTVFFTHRVFIIAISFCEQRVNSTKADLIAGPIFSCLDYAKMSDDEDENPETDPERIDWNSGEELCQKIPPGKKNNLSMGVLGLLIKK